MDGWAVASRAATAWLSAVRLPGSESWEMPSGVRFLKSSRIRTQAFFGAMRGRTGTATPPRRGITRRRRSSVQKMGPEVSGGGGGGAGGGATSGGFSSVFTFAWAFGAEAFGAAGAGEAGAVTAAEEVPPASV